MMVGVNIDLKINGTLYYVESSEDLENLKVYIDQLLSWVRSIPKPIALACDDSVPYTPPVRVPTRAEDTRSKISGVRKRVGERAVDYIVRALQDMHASVVINGVSSEEVFRRVKKIGWTSRADTDKKAIAVLEHTSARSPGVLRYSDHRIFLDSKGHPPEIDDDVEDMI